MPVSVEGQVEHQKLNETEAWCRLVVFGVKHDSLEKSVSTKAEKKVEFISFISDCVVFGQPLRKKT